MEGREGQDRYPCVAKLGLITTKDCGGGNSARFPTVWKYRIQKATMRCPSPDGHRLPLSDREASKWNPIEHRVYLRNQQLKLGREVRLVSFQTTLLPTSERRRPPPDCESAPASSGSKYEIPDDSTSCQRSTWTLRKKLSRFQNLAEHWNYTLVHLENDRNYFCAGPKLLIYGLFQKGRVLAQDGVQSCVQVGPGVARQAGRDFRAGRRRTTSSGTGNSFAMTDGVGRPARSAAPTAAAPLRSAAGRRQTFFLPRSSCTSPALGAPPTVHF